MKGSRAGWVWIYLESGVETLAPSADVSTQRQGTEEERGPKAEP